MLTDPERWRKARGAYMQEARRCKATLTDMRSHWRYAPDDIRVKEAVAKWVTRARNAHAFALGRKPVIEHFLIIDGNRSCMGPLYAGRRL
ncbi:MAG TPA: hypothetical protein VFE62_03030 [Gemmataceae bacterium]|nr:hypothetical protein [Gemmataceae bacterium]